MRFFSFTGPHIKVAGVICFVLVTSTLLSGCAGMMNKLGYVPIESSSVKACAATPVLITNLTINSKHDQYQLPNGKICPGVHNDEKNSSQSKDSEMQNNIL